MLRRIYTILFYFAVPFIFLKLFLKSRRAPAYAKRISERFGMYSVCLPNCIWIHSVSVGETIAAIPLIKLLIQKYPHLPMVVTTMTPTGAARVKAAFGDQVTQLYLPYDLPLCVNKFLNAINPVIAIFMETELWPNLLAACAHKNIPVCLLNARMSAESARGYARISAMTREMLSSLTLIATQTEKDSDRLIALGAGSDRVHVTGNIKFDLTIADNLQDDANKFKNNLGADRPIWIAASTHAGEEVIVLAAHHHIRITYPDALLILVPRHPDRFNEVAKLTANQFNMTSRSLNETCDEHTEVYFADTMGEMLLLYATADVAFVAGSLIARGGHNLLEPAALSKPIISGPNLHNFIEVRDQLLQANALTIVSDVDELAKTVLELFADKKLASEMGARAALVVANNRGALAKQMVLVEEVMSDK